MAAAVATSPAAAAPPFCTVEITLTPSEQEAPVTSTQPGAVEFHGEYHVDFPSFERGQLSLTAVVDQNWVATVSPASITITNARTGVFTVTSIVPAGTPPDPVGQLVVTARLTAGGIQCQDQAQAVISPRPYFDGFNGRISPAPVNLNDGKGSLQLTVGADASVPVTATLELTGPEGLVMRGPTSVNLPVPASGTANVTVTLDLEGPGLPSGTYNVTILVKGTTQDGATKQREFGAPLVVNQGVVSGLSSPLGLIGVAGAVAAGAFVWWRFSARGRA